MKCEDLFINSDDVLIIHKKLAVMLSLNEAIFLNQLNYWILHTNNPDHFKEGRIWVYNSYTEWAENNFPFWSAETVKRTISSLKSKKIVKVGNFNKSKMEKTNWYTIDYDKLDEFRNEYEKCKNQPTGQNDQTDRSSCNTDIIYNIYNNKNTETTNIDYIGINTPLSAKAGVTDAFTIAQKQIEKEMKKQGYEKDNYLTKGIVDLTHYYFKTYKQWFNAEHPILSNSAVEGMVDRFLALECDNSLVVNYYDQLIDEHFKNDYGQKIDYNICHFMTNGVIDILMCRLI